MSVQTLWQCVYQVKRRLLLNSCGHDIAVALYLVLLATTVNVISAEIFCLQNPNRKTRRKVSWNPLVIIYRFESKTQFVKRQPSEKRIIIENECESLRLSNTN